MPAIEKTWTVTSNNPRPTHAEIDGETVAYQEPFSNGLYYPGDAMNGDAAEVANCTCVMGIGGEVQAVEEPIDAGYGDIPQTDSPVDMPSTDMSEDFIQSELQQLGEYIYGSAVNEDLRAGISGPEVSVLDDAFAKSTLSEDTILYRGVPADVRSDILSVAKAGYIDPAFVSATADLKYADSWARQSTLVLKAPAGTHAIDVPAALGYGDQSEMILERGLTFKFSSFDDQGRVVLKVMK